MLSITNGSREGGGAAEALEVIVLAEGLIFSLRSKNPVRWKLCGGQPLRLRASDATDPLASMSPICRVFQPNISKNVSRIDPLCSGIGFLFFGGKERCLDLGFS